MPATFGGGNDLPAGDYVAHVTEVKTVEVKDFNDPNKMVRKFLWNCDVEVSPNVWQRYGIFTGMEFKDVSKIKNPQFVPKFCRLVRACGMALPTNAQEAAAWHEDHMAGKRFRLVIKQDEETGVLQEKYLPLAGNGNGQQAAPTPAPAPTPEPTPQRELVGAGVASGGGSGVDSDDDIWDKPGA